MEAEVEEWPYEKKKLIGGEEPQIPNPHQQITKISSSIFVHSKSRRNRSATGKMCIRAELFLLRFYSLLKLEAITGHAAPSCVYSSLTSFNLQSILNSIFAEFAAFSYSTYSITWSNWNCNLFNKQWTWVEFNSRGKEDFSSCGRWILRRPLRMRVFQRCKHEAGPWQAHTLCFSIMNFLCDLYQKTPFVCLFSSCKIGISLSPYF